MRANHTLEKIELWTNQIQPTEGTEPLMEPRTKTPSRASSLGWTVWESESRSGWESAGSEQAKAALTPVRTLSTLVALRVLLLSALLRHMPCADPDGLFRPLPLRSLRHVSSARCSALTYRDRDLVRRSRCDKGRFHRETQGVVCQLRDWP